MIAWTQAEYQSDTELTKDPNGRAMGCLLRIFSENWLRYNGTHLYMDKLRFLHNEWYIINSFFNQDGGDIKIDKFTRISAV